MTDDVIIEVSGGCGRISLNRPKALHALTLDMCRTIITALRAWDGNPAIGAILIDHSEGRGFCAGGDVRALYHDLLGERAEALAFFRTEYTMNDLLYGMTTPTVCFMDGIVMGGGAGLAMPSRFRVATEATAYAMPETGIGLFPDVGGGWFLSRLPGRIGEWLALTGSRLDGSECLNLGLATHYMPRAVLHPVKERITESPRAVENILEEFSMVPPPPNFTRHRGDIDRLFGVGDVEAIIAALAADGSAWALAQQAEIMKKSPLSSKVALRQLAESRVLSRFSDNMRMEFRIATRIIAKPDFREGVRALVMDKDGEPKWSPQHFAEVSAGDVDRIFAPLTEREEWQPLEKTQ